MLKIKNLDVHYGKIPAVRRVSMHVNQGEIVALIGSNGAGKTTLLSTISGLHRPTAGSIEFQGANIVKRRPDRIVEDGISHVPEGRLVFSPMAVEDNLALGAFVRRGGKYRDEVRRDMEAVYEIFPILKERRTQAAGTLSGGEQQMLAIGRALMAGPKLLLLDEPSMGLAPNITQEIFRHIVGLRDAFDLTVLLVEQNARSALKISDRGYVLETGRITIQGPAEELAANRDVQRAYLGGDLDREEA